MKITVLNESDHESVNRYLDVIPTDDYNNLCMVDYGDKRYVIASRDDVFSIVENDNGQLNPMEINLDENGNFLSYTTEQFSYVMRHEDDNMFIQKTDQLLKDDRHLHFVKNVDSGSLLEYRQFIADNFGAMTAKYELVHHNLNSASAISYANYNLPTTLEVHESKSTMFSYKERIYFYHLVDQAYYRRAYIVGKHKYHLSSIVRYPGDKLIRVYCDAFGFMDTIDEDLKSYMLGSNAEFNDRKQLILGYQEYIKGQK